MTKDNIYKIHIFFITTVNTSVKVLLRLSDRRRGTSYTLIKSTINCKHNVSSLSIFNEEPSIHFYTVYIIKRSKIISKITTIFTSFDMIIRNSSNLINDMI